MKLTDELGRLREKIKSLSSVDENGCWLWGGTPDRYGTIFLSGKAHRAHRQSFRAFVGELVPGLCICHKCDVPGCVNPSHLFQGTRSDNMSDMVSKGRNAKTITKSQDHFKSGRAPFGERASGAKLTEDQAQRLLYDKADGLRTKELSQKYGITKWAVQSIVRSQTWTHLDRPHLRGETGRSALKGEE